MNYSPFGGPFASPSPQQFQAKEETPPTSSPSTFVNSESPVQDNQYFVVNTQLHPPNSVPTSDNKYQQPLSMLNNNHFSQNSFGQHVQQLQENETSASDLQSSQQPLRESSLKELSSEDVYQQQTMGHNQVTAMPSTWQSLAAPGSTVADYLSHLPASTLPISLHHFLKYSAESIKKETESTVTLPPHPQALSQTSPQQKKKKKKRAVKEKKQQRPRPGEIRLTTALDGTTLYCCPECHMAYREKELLEQHLLSHKLERRFICDICGAGLKRKDHLTRHKQSHNPERPFVCTICAKAFKRKEQLTLHFVIHSGEKRHVCPECNKGFYRKDHLRKHTRSHLSRRVKAEMTTQVSNPTIHQPPTNHLN